MGALNQAIRERVAWFAVWGGRSMGWSCGLKFGYLSIEQFFRSGVAQDFAGHIVDTGGDLVTVLLSDMTQGFAFREVAADNAVIAFVASTLTGSEGVAIVDGQTLVVLRVMFHAVAVLELGTIIYSDGLEGASWEHWNDEVEGPDGSGASLVWDFKYILIAGLALRED